MEWVYDDGGRIAAEYKGHHEMTRPAGDCVCRSISIVCMLDYDKVNTFIKELCRQTEDKIKLDHNKSSHEFFGYKVGSQVGLPKYIYHQFIKSLGLEWAPACFTGKHRVDTVGRVWAPWPEADRKATVKRYPATWPNRGPTKSDGKRYLVYSSAHMTAVVDGTLHDIVDCRKWQAFGYWKLVNPIPEYLAEVLV